MCIEPVQLGAPSSRSKALKCGAPVRAGVAMDVAMPLLYQASEERVLALQASEKRAKVRGYLMTFYGFVLGFMMAFAMLLCYEPFLLQSEQLRRHSRSAEYSLQRDRRVARQLVANATTALQRRLTDEVRVLCLVMTHPKNHRTAAAAVRATWGKHCSKLVFWSSVWDEELGTVPVVEPEADVYDNLWNKTREGFRYAYEQYFDDYDWFLKADDDTYVVMENLRYMLYPYSPDVPIFFGWMFYQEKTIHMSGGAGYVLSKEALRRFVDNGLSNSELCDPGSSTLPEDYAMSICLKNLDVIPADSRTALPTDDKPKFFPLEVDAFMTNDILNRVPWLLEITPFKFEMGLECCSNYTISYHYVSPARMYLHEFLIYRLQLFGCKQFSPLAELPAKLTLDEIKSRFTYKLIESNQTNAIDD